MSSPPLSACEVTTSLGVVPLSARDGVYDGDGPVVLAIADARWAASDLSVLPGVVGVLADACVMQLPGVDGPALATPGVAAAAQAVGEVLQSTFAGRRVMLLGVSLGGTVALAVRAPNLARIVAIEPILSTDGLWPAGPSLRQAWMAADAAMQATLHAYYGLTANGAEPRDYLPLLEGLQAPADIVLGDVPLAPQRPLQRFPSLASEDVRAALAAHPRVRLHRAPGTGHSVLGQAPKAGTAVVMEAVRRAADPDGALAPDEPLLDATPIAARRVGYVGGDLDAFAAAFNRFAPKAEVSALGAGVAGALDVVVAAARPSDGELAALAACLAPDGHLVARWAAPREAIAARLAPHALLLREPVDDAGTGVIRAQKRPDGAPPQPALHVHTVMFAHFMMDIRTRLPARGMASDPDLQVVYDNAPTERADLPFDHPKITVMQRNANIEPEQWLPLLVNSLRLGWVVVAEFDDHPLLISEVQGKPTSPNQMRRFGYAHAVQTATEPLVAAFRPFNPETVAFSNAVFSLPPFPSGPRPKRVFYGAVLRGDYGVTVARALAPVVAEHPDVEFVVVGDEAVFEALPTEHKTLHSYVSFERYLELMSQCSVSLSPIAPLPMRETKSDAKFLDASRAGVLTIGSPTIYAPVIEHGVNGLIAPEVADWAPLLSRALADPTGREAMARRAWDYVRSERMFAEQVRARLDWYRDLWARREALNAALIDRLPQLRAALAASPAAR